MAGNADPFRVDLEEGPLPPPLAMTGERAGAEADDGNRVQTAAGGTRRADDFRERSSGIVRGLRQHRAADRRAIVVSQPLGAVDRGAVIKNKGPAIGDLGHSEDAEEAARGLDGRYSRPPQAVQR